jgi:4-hydroxy-tetrahydrodipicolinate synthase
LIGRLIEAFPDTVVGIKESAGDFNNMQAIIAAYPGFSVWLAPIRCCCRC